MSYDLYTIVVRILDKLKINITKKIHFKNAISIWLKGTGEVKRKSLLALGSRGISVVHETKFLSVNPTDFVPTLFL